MQCQSMGLRLGGWAVLAALTLLPAGCEVDSANRRIEIRPNSAIVKYGETVTLSALNGYVYDWSLSDSTIGALSSHSGMQVTYTSLTDPVTPVVQIVTVTSSFSDEYDQSDTGSNAPVVHSAEAYITHVNATNNPWAAE